jgi:signal transduction histidine kinase
VRQIVLAHGGTIEVRSSREEGTTFTVTLPRQPARTGREDPAVAFTLVPTPRQER